MEFNFFTFIFLFAILTSVIALLWLNFRQDRAIKISFNEVPEGFKETITLEDHQKAGRYTQAKLLANHFEIIFSTIVLLIWTLGGAMNWLDVFWHEKISDPIWLGTVFILSITVTMSLRSTSFSVMWLPIKPAPPVTTYLIMFFLFLLHDIQRVILFLLKFFYNL